MTGTNGSIPNKWSRPQLYILHIRNYSCPGLLFSQTGNTVTYCDTNAVTYCDTNAITYCYTNAVTYWHCDTNTATYCESNAVTYYDTNTVTYCDTNAVTYCYTILLHIVILMLFFAGL